MWRTRNMDFMRPKGVHLGPEDMGQDLATGSFAFDAPPKVPAPQKNKAGGTPEGNSPGGNSPEGKESALQVGDLQASPGLYEYLAQARKGTDYLFRLSATLQSGGHFQRSLLALERVIDSAEATPEEQARAAQAIAKLAPTLPAWNVDPSVVIPLELHLGSARKTDEAIKEVTLKLATAIHNHSGDQVEITPVISSGSGENAVANGPIAIWFTTLGDESASTSVLSTTPETEDSEVLYNGLSLTAYRLVRSYLARVGYATTPPPPNIKGPELLAHHITRRMWYDFAQTLLGEQQANKESQESNKAAPVSE